MHSVVLHKRIYQCFDLLYRLGLWHRGDLATVKETRIKIFFSIYFFFLPVSMFAGAIKSGSTDEAILLTQTAVMVIVLGVRFLCIIWRKKEIIDLLHRVCVYSIKDFEDFKSTNAQISSFMKLIMFFYSYLSFICICATIIVPFVGPERKLFYNIGFPLDYTTSEISYWIAFTFLVIEGFLSVVSVLFSILVWFLLLNCCLKYKVLGGRLRNMGVAVDSSGEKLILSEVATQNLFSRDLYTGMESYDNINEATEHVELFISKIISLQLATSAICICASIHCLAYINKDSFFETIIYIFYLLYNIFDIFMVMYFGNEIELSSDQLSYCLFESNWIDQPQSCKKSVIIFGERLKRARQLLIFKLYPVTLETFVRILNSAYSMFNILKNLT